jgi:hypothetical protein
VAGLDRCTGIANVFSHVPSTNMREIAAMLDAIHADEDIVAARQKAVQMIEKLRDLRPINAAELVEAAVEETLPLCLLGGALAYPNQQFARTHSARDQAAHPRRRVIDGQRGCSQACVISPAPLGRPNAI